MKKNKNQNDATTQIYTLEVEEKLKIFANLLLDKLHEQHRGKKLAGLPIQK